MMNVMNFQDYDVIQLVFDAIEKENISEAQDCLTDNFKSVVLRQDVSRDEFLEIYRRIKEGIPDIKFIIMDLTSDGETFKANVKITGTHTQTIPSLKKGWKSMKPTGKKINKIVTAVEIVLRSDRIMEIRNLDGSKGVIAGLLNELQLLPKNYSLN
jgi:predicted ester cyclase